MGKIKTIIKDGLEPLKEGKKNFNNPIEEAERLAEERTLECLDCVHYKKEPISFLRVEDKRIPELSEMMCGDCGCELPYKLRQSIKKCKKWQD